MSEIFYSKERSMSFREKSAWAMLLLVACVGAFYVQGLVAIGIDGLPHGLAIELTILMVTGAIIVEVALAILTPKEADTPADERERTVIERAGHWSGLVLGFGVVSALGHFLSHGNGNIMFNVIVIALFVSTLVEYTAQIILFRSRV